MSNKKLTTMILIISIILISCKPIVESVHIRNGENGANGVYGKDGVNGGKIQNFSEIDCVEGYKFIITEYGRKFTQIFDDVGRGIKCE